VEGAPHLAGVGRVGVAEADPAGATCPGEVAEARVPGPQGGAQGRDPAEQGGERRREEVSRGPLPLLCR